MFASQKDTFKLYNGVEIPCIGYGTWKMPDSDEGINATSAALEYGYRHIDTAAGYKNEKSVGQAIKKSGIQREEVFITSKLYNDMHGYDNTMQAFETTLSNLDTDYLDLYLIHWPNPIKFRDQWQDANAGTWKAFEELYTAGRIKAIGISNFMVRHIEELMKTAEIKPMVNQILLCPGETQPELVEYCRKQDMLLEAYSPFGSGLIFSVPEIKTMSEKYGKSIAQICVRWSLQMGFLPLPKSVTNSRIHENMQVFDFNLSDEDVQTLINLKSDEIVVRNPDIMTF